MTRKPFLPVGLFDYNLPEDLIAQSPAKERTGSRLLRIDRPSSAVDHLTFDLFPGLLREDDLLVVNDTRVFPARLNARRKTGGALEILLLEYPFSKGESSCLVRPGKRIRSAEEVVLDDGSTVILRKNGDRFFIQGKYVPMEEVVRLHGKLPLPPYIHREGGIPRMEDNERYQTVYADRVGAVAAPTAGLHFDDKILRSIRKRGIRVVMVTLHVGPGTFQPVRIADASKHRMESEVFDIPSRTAAAVMETRASGGRVVAVGTTVVRTLESGWDGRKLAAGEGSTELFIFPGYRFGIVDALITNFHLPRSTLLMLVCAFGGTELVMKAYREAVKERYRFYSYGDAMFIE